MVELPTSKFIEFRDGGHFIAGTRIGLFILVDEFRNGQSAENILRSYPSIGSLVKVYGAITFILEHPQEIENYLQGVNTSWEKFKAEHPMPDHVVESMRRAQEELARRSS
jgi:uncharacterized protein (DUF433 family)